MALLPRSVAPLLAALALLLSGCMAVRPDRVDHLYHAFLLVAPKARTVAVAGSFNGWDPNCHPLAGPERDGTWSATLQLQPGRYEYLFVIDGAEWTLDPLAPSTNDGMGGRNSLLILPALE